MVDATSDGGNSEQEHEPQPQEGGSQHEPQSRTPESKRRRWRSWFISAGAAAALVFVVAVVWLLHVSSAWDVKVTGLPDRPIRPAAISQGAIKIKTDNPLAVSAEIDGKAVPLRRGQGQVTLMPPRLPDGSHELVLSVPSAVPGMGDRTISKTFTVDGTAPGLKTPKTLESKSFGSTITVSGKAKDAFQVTVNGEAVKVDDTGRFSTEITDPPAVIPVVATDKAGNRTTSEIVVAVVHPGMRAVHMTGLAWTSDTLREPILDMVRNGLIDTIELDIKDESGEVQYDSDVALAEKIGAVKGYYNARKVLDKLHSMGVRVVGRLVAFKDPILAEWSWTHGHRERVVQTPSGQPFNGGYGSFPFTNFANPVVRQYNIDIAEEAAKLGFDDILYDYVRRPDGYRENMRFPGLSTTPSKSIANFVKDTRAAIREHGAFLGACVFGITVTRPESVGQNIPMMAKYLDYVAPMIYPSHWGPGEYGVPHPNRQPYKIVRRSLEDWKQVVKGTHTKVIPWLQDFSLGVPYGPEEVAAQIKATHDAGLDSFLLWNAGARYTAAALKPQG